MNATLFAPLVSGLMALWMCGGRPASALTIYRIGGASLPPPALSREEGVDFVQLDWQSVDGLLHGRAEQLVLDANFIEPVRLDPAVNLVPGIADLGGGVYGFGGLGWGTHDPEDALAFDGDPDTAYLGDGRFTLNGGPRKNLAFDLGAEFLLERIRFYPRRRFFDERFVERFIIGIRDGDPRKEGTRGFVVAGDNTSRDFDVLYDIAENNRALVELDLPPVPIREILFSAPENVRGIWEIAEFEIYGRDFAPRARYASNAIDLGAASALGEMAWAGRQDSGAVVELSMRAGDDDDPNAYWRSTFRGAERTRFDEQGRVLDRAAYNRLKSGEKAGTTYDAAHWDFWSPPFDFAAGKGTAPAAQPRRFVQFQFAFRSAGDAGSRVDYLQFAASRPPFVSLILAEIAPFRVPAGRAVPFTYSLLPHFESEEPGFDRIEIRTAVPVETVDAVRYDRAPVAFAVVHRDADGFELAVPRVDPSRSGDLIEVDFQVPVFRFGTVFSGRVFDSERPHEVRQTVAAGDADPLVDSERLAVELEDLGQDIVHSLRLQPGVFTPNGDGVNDEVRIEFELVNVFGSASFAVDLHDLAGGRRTAVARGSAASGAFTVDWNGRDARGEPVAPGLYILRLQVATDRGETAVQQTMGVAY